MPIYTNLPSFDFRKSDINANDVNYQNVSGTQTTVGATLQYLEQAVIASGAKIYYDTTENWDKQISLVSERGSIYVYSDKYIIDNQNVPALKVGDGLAYVVDLPFVEKEFYDHINDTVVHLSQQDRWKLENSVCAEMSTVEAENLNLYN